MNPDSLPMTIRERTASTLVRTLIVTVFGCLAMAESQAAESPACSRTLTVGYYDAGAFYDPSTDAGIDRDVMEEIGRRTGCKFSGKFLSRGLIFLAFEQGKLDVVTSAIPTPERLKFGAASPFFWVRNELITKKDHDVHDSPEAFLADSKLRLGVINRYLYGAGWDEWIDALRKQGRVEVVGDTHQLMRLLDAGRIDAFPAVPLGSGTYVRLYGDQPSLRRFAWFTNAPANPGGLLLSLKTLDEPTRAAIRQALQEMKNDGSLMAIFLKYVNDRKTAETMLVPSK